MSPLSILLVPIFVSLSVSVPFLLCLLCYFSLFIYLLPSDSFLFLVSLPGPSLCLYLSPHVPLCLTPSGLSLCISIPVYVSFSTINSIPIFISVLVTLPEFLPHIRPQSVAFAPPWPEPGSVLDSAAPSRPPACPSRLFQG